MKDKKSQEEIVATFNGMRGEQRQIASKTNELQQDLNEHNIVIETLQGVDADRKCFRYAFSSTLKITASIYCKSSVTHQCMLCFKFNLPKVSFSSFTFI